MSNNYLYDYMMDKYIKNNLIEFKSLIELLNLYGIDRERSKWDYYKFDSIGVPRVTNILNSTNSKDLSGWISGLGKSYFSVRKSILDTGSLTHAMIEDFIMNGGKASYYSDYRNANENEANNAFNNFISWYNDMNNKGYSIEPIFVERQIVTPFYGGTCDFCANLTINGITKTYILDFKTSKKISYEYFMQIMFYILGMKFNNETNHEKFPNIDGLGIIRVDKQYNQYNFVLANFEDDPQFMQDLISAVYSCIDWYYKCISIKNQSYDFNKSFEW